MSTDIQHPSPEEIAAYQRRTLAPGDLLSVDDHLAQCEVCRAQVDGAERLGRAVGAIRGELANAVETLEHPPTEHVAAFVDGELEDVERELVESHLEICRSCAEDVGDLRAARGSMKDSSLEAPRKSPSGWLGYGVVTALAAGLAGLLVWIEMRSAPEPGPEPGRVATSAVEPPVPQPSSPPTLVTLKDGGANVTVLADGSTRGLPPLAEGQAEAIRLALAEGRIRLPSLVSDLRGAAGTLMSGVSDASVFQLVRPIATVVETDRPMFEWTRLQGATAYVVAVFDLDFNKVAESPPLAATSWPLQTPLARGRTYLWQVRASRAGEDIVAPAPPAPEARFGVFSQTEAVRLEGVRRQYAGFHLVLGVLLAQAGELDEAERELERLVTANPGIPEPQRLLASLRHERKEVSSRR